MLGQHGISISPEEKTFLINYGRGKRLSFSDSATLIPLKSQFANEFIAESIQKKHYLEAQEREAYRVSCNEGFFYDANHEILSGAYVYVLLPNDCLYCVEVAKNINHSYLSTGLGVKGAGIVYFEAGRLMNLSNESGHYAPTFEEMESAINWFYKQVNGHRFLFEDHSVQDKEAEFNGIRYFSVKPDKDAAHCAKELLNNNDLAQTLQEIRNTELSYYYDHLQVQTTPVEEVSFVEIDDDDTTNVYISKIDLTIIPFPLASPIFDHPELLKLTVLAKALENQDGHKPLSRFGCVLKQSKGC